MFDGCCTVCAKRFTGSQLREFRAELYFPVHSLDEGTFYDRVRKTTVDICTGCVDSLYVLGRRPPNFRPAQQFEESEGIRYRPGLRCGICFDSHAECRLRRCEAACEAKDDPNFRVIQEILICMECRRDFKRKISPHESEEG